jgi:hypothetical protein
MGVPEQPRLILVVDVRTLTEPDLRTIEVLARLQLTARRLGATIRLGHTCDQMRDLLACSGMSELLPLDADSGVDGDRLPEEGKELLVDEEVDPRDPAP